MRKLLLKLEELWDRPRYAARRRLGYRRPVVQPYRGFGTERELWLKGRVLEEGCTRKPTASDSALANAICMFRRYESDEIPGATVLCRHGDQEKRVTSDEEGFFEVRFEVAPSSDPAPGELWRQVDLTLVDPVGPDAAPVRRRGLVLTPPARAAMGLISDIDDTIVRTGAFDLLRHWRAVVTTNAYTRTAFPGVGPFYRAIQGGSDDAAVNPIFYVSSSPWNLYDLFEQFMAFNGIPLGPMMLKDFGLDAGKLFTGGHEGHKTSAIERILETYPTLPFILVGDSGQRDAAIYAEIARRHPGRVAAIYLRDVMDSARDAELANLLREVDTARTQIVIGETMVDAARNAAIQGWIGSESVAAVREAVDAT